MVNGKETAREWSRQGGMLIKGGRGFCQGPEELDPWGGSAAYGWGVCVSVGRDRRNNTTLALPNGVEEMQRTQSSGWEGGRESPAGQLETENWNDRGEDLQARGGKRQREEIRWHWWDISRHNARVPKGRDPSILATGCWQDVADDSPAEEGYYRTGLNKLRFATDGASRECDGEPVTVSAEDTPPWDRGHQWNGKMAVQDCLIGQTVMRPVGWAFSAKSSLIERTATAVVWLERAPGGWRTPRQEGRGDDHKPHSHWTGRIGAAETAIGGHAPGQQSLDAATSSQPGPSPAVMGCGGV
ncbi:hypothetical protein MAPG_03833 [Magnaporthiopsis poae ATCC 64411]|uniref:Uncharacterized protein n=1 Tax=Magnaporthiopsis poae (strain ATCC 64411 / 73-15) TaxID=644358 RepID=A0A0C4DV33_MAGP6|nr:hypothetical protein MAPG_03833 [Magnaporthiopsis poae ATCC 64411]